MYICRFNPKKPALLNGFTKEPDFSPIITLKNSSRFKKEMTTPLNEQPYLKIAQVNLRSLRKFHVSRAPFQVIPRVGRCSRLTAVTSARTDSFFQTFDRVLFFSSSLIFRKGSNVCCAFHADRSFHRSITRRGAGTTGFRPEKNVEEKRRHRDKRFTTQIFSRSFSPVAGVTAA